MGNEIVTPAVILRVLKLNRLLRSCPYPPIRLVGTVGQVLPVAGSGIQGTLAPARPVVATVETISTWGSVWFLKYWISIPLISFWRSSRRSSGRFLRASSSATLRSTGDKSKVGVSVGVS